MYDISNAWEGDLDLSDTGDLLLVEPGQNYTLQRLIRTLFTNPGNVELHPAFGIGIGSWIGETFGEPEALALEGLVYINLLGIVEIQNPTVSVILSSPTLLTVVVSYIDAVTGQPSKLSFGVGA